MLTKGHFQKRLANDEAITQNSSWTSAAIQLNGVANEGIFSIHYNITGAGTIKFEYLLSFDGTNYAEPFGASDIKTGAATGDGYNVISFQPEPAPFMKIKATEENAGAITALDLDIFIQ